MLSAAETMRRYIFARTLSGSISSDLAPLLASGGALAERKQRHAELDARGHVARTRVHRGLVLLAGPWQVVDLPQQRPELRAQVRELRAQTDGLLVLGDRLARETGVRVGLAHLGVHVGDFAAREGVEPQEVAAGRPLDPRVDLPRGLVLAAVVVRHGQVERGLGVARVDRERALEVVLGLGEVAARVADDAEHVVHVGEAVVLVEDLPQHLLGLLELALLIVLAAEEQELLGVLVHGHAGAPGHEGAARPPARGYDETRRARESDFLRGDCTLACFLAPGTVCR